MVRGLGDFHTVTRLPGVMVVLPILVVATTAASATPMSLRFEPGSYGAMIDGRVTDGGADHAYSMDVRAGQTMIITFTGEGPMVGSVECKGGGDGPFYGDVANTFIVPRSGLCIIKIGANHRSDPQWTGGFTLSILLTKPAPKDGEH